MAEYKVVISTKDGKSYQKELKSPEADALSKKKIGDKISGDSMGLPGYEFEITGGSDKCGFPMRKGVQAARKIVFIGKGVGFCGKNRNKKTQKGLKKRRTVCGEKITSIIRQVNLKVLQEGAKKFWEVEVSEENATAEKSQEASAETKEAERPAEGPAQEAKETSKEEKPAEEVKESQETQEA